MPLVEAEDDFVPISVPVNSQGEVVLKDLRDFVAVTEDEPQLSVARFLPGELRLEVQR